MAKEDERADGRKTAELDIALGLAVKIQAMAPPRCSHRLDSARNRTGAPCLSPQLGETIYSTW